ncbi:CSC1-like protein RXW8 isoform X5 [Prosopis cineraria]|uniref:CSC1-like protein RXW8 isoform X5 n=1 Tax=Prosopis cineraria TaxID=364024 RepID=UPI00240FCD8D|nr:CSC1-like protein RXW8 isoform X5 [Prosopis cineraria]
MKIVALFTSAGINIGICAVLLSLYSILRKQPGNVNVYFGRRLASKRSRRTDLCLERFVPSPSWILKAWHTTEDELLAVGGLDAVVFIRIVVFSLRVFSIAAIICTVLVLPVNYYGQEGKHKDISFEPLEVFSIENVKEGSKWLWAHCLALYIITIAACALSYFEFKAITNLRLVHIIGSPPNPSHFAIVVRGIPWYPEVSYYETVRKFFSNYHESTYLSHQMIYKSGTVQKLKDDAELMYKSIKGSSFDQRCKPHLPQCFCGGPRNSFKMISNEIGSIHGRTAYDDVNIDERKKECAAAFVFFKTRYAALVASQILQTSNPMLWVTDRAPEPHDIYWSNLCIPYRQLWIRKIAILVASVVFMLMFLIPVTFVQGLTQLDHLQESLPFLKGILEKKYVGQIVTGYLPSVILILFLYVVPPTMMLFSAIEGSISRSRRKKSACYKVLFFLIWNVFFVNVFTGSVISQLSVFNRITNLPEQLAKEVPAQLINVYVTKYDSGGEFWPIAHNTTVFALIFTQIVALGVFGMKRSTVASGFTVPLLILTILFHEYCRQRFLPIFKDNSTQVLIDMDRRDEHAGKMEEIYDQLHAAYCQFTSATPDSDFSTNTRGQDLEGSNQVSETSETGNPQPKR